MGMFDSDVAKPKDESGRRGRKIIAVCALVWLAVILAVIFVPRGLGWAEQRRMHAALHDGMSQTDVFAALGEPRAIFNCGRNNCDSWSLQDHPIEQLSASFLVYRPGANRAMVILFRGREIEKLTDFEYEGPSEDEDKAYQTAAQLVWEMGPEKGHTFNATREDGAKELLLVTGDRFYGRYGCGVIAGAICP
jgi:hypothetical protein